MVNLKANEELEKIYKRLINTMGEDVKWSGVFGISNNTLVLNGEIQSLIFDFDLKQVYSNIIDVNENGEIFEISDRKLIINILNMLLYVFGKWKAIRGLNVEQDYDRLSNLFKNILSEIDIDVYYSPSGIKFIKNGIQIVFEDVIQEAIDKIKAAEEEQAVSEEDEEEHTRGLWHDMQWKVEACSFTKCEVSEEKRKNDRPGHNFYAAPYQCPECQNSMHMIVYPEKREFPIDTDDGKVFLTRAYVCKKCCKFYTPRPHKLIAEGDVYALDFDNDDDALEDYMKLMGRTGRKTHNCNFNMYESDYYSGAGRKQINLSQVCANLDKLNESELNELLAMMEEDFYSEVDVERFMAIIEQELEYRKKLQENQTGEFGRRSDIEESDNLDDSDISDIEHMADNDNKLEEDQDKAANESKAEQPDDKNSDTELSQSNRKSEINTDLENTSVQNTTSQTIENDNKKLGKKQILDKKEENKAVKSSVKAGNHSDVHYSDKEGEAVYTDKKLKAGNEKSDSFETENEQKDVKGSAENDSSEGTAITQENINKSSHHAAKNVNTEKKNAANVEKDEHYFKKAVAECVHKKYAEVNRIIDELKKSACGEELKNELMGKLISYRKEKGRSELDYLTSNIPANDTKERYKRIRERIKDYKDIDTEKYEDIVERHISRAEQLELSSMMKRVNPKSRQSVIEMTKRMKDMSFEKENLQPFLDKLNDKLIDIDNETVRKICPDLNGVGYEEGLKAIKEIEQAEILPEIKSNALELIDKRLTRMKTDECEQLVRKLTKKLDGWLSDASRIHYYDIRKMQAGDNKDEESLLIRKAISTYAIGMGKYEYPIVIYDSSVFKNGKDGFIITPDHIFYKGFFKSGSIDVMNIDHIVTDTGKAAKAIYAEHNSGAKVKLPCTAASKDIEVLTGVLEEFVAYLKEKPESRNVSYMAQKSHASICCYRCGYTFKGGNICPKCGSKN